MSVQRRNLLIWPALLVTGAVAAVGVVAVLRLPVSEWLGESVSTDGQIVMAVEKTEEVSLLTLHVEGVRTEERADGTFLGITIPNSRAAFVKYRFDAKVGINGADVTIEDTGDKTFTVRVPEFVMIGKTDPNVQIASADDLLSWTTPKIETDEVVNTILGPAGEAEYINDNRDALQQQTRDFYTGIVTAIDPDVILTFAFTG